MDSQKRIENQSSTPSGMRLDHYIIQSEHWQPAGKNTTIRSGIQKMVAKVPDSVL
jgi:hypothetical protein